MKITQITFIKQSEVPVAEHSGELSHVANALAEQISKAQPGQAVRFTLEGTKKWTRYALQKKLQKRGCRVRISSIDGKGTFAAVTAEVPVKHK